MTSDVQSELVRHGYDVLSYHYRSDDAGDGQYRPWLADLSARLPSRAAVLDISDVQIERARRLVSNGIFIRADVTRLDFASASFDAVVCLYTLIHLALRDQPGLIRRIARWLRPHGWLLATVGQEAWTGTEDNWLSGPARMWWSQADADTYRSWLGQAGLVVTSQEFVPEGASGHALIWAQRPGAI
jgi:ubiquinone/menaquinone biosynthesis C-methylase UbiE